MTVVTIKRYVILTISGVLMAVGFFLVSIVDGFFGDIAESKKEHAARKELVAAGKVEPLQGKVVEKRYEEDKYWTGSGDSRTLKVDIDFWLILEIETVGKVPRGVTKAIYESFVEGQTVKVYAVEDTYVIPAFEVDDSQSIRLGKILFLGVSYVPVLLGLFGLCFVCVGMLWGRKR